MKKLILSIAVLATAGTMFAQRPMEGANPFSLEGELSLNSAAGSTFAAPTIRLRYFVMDNLAIRVGGSFNSQTEREYFYGSEATPQDYSDSIGILTSKSSGYTFSLGASYHFSQLEKLSPYVGVDFVMGGASYRMMGDRTNGTTWQDDLTWESKAPAMHIGGRLVAGVDWYFAENLFLGAEFSWGVTSITYKDQYLKVTTDGETTEIETPVTGSAAKSLGLGHNFIGGLRIGWRF